MNAEMTNEEIDDAFETFTAIPPEQWDNDDADELVETLRSEGKTEAAEQLSESEITASLRMLGKVANEYDRDTFAETIQDGELPPIELTEEEMQKVRGGIVLTATAMAVATAAGAAGYYMAENAS